MRHPAFMVKAPSVFVSYSHDDDAHKRWVLMLATRLVANGVDAILDQWDMRLGGNLPTFMEKGLTNAERVLAICSEAYVQKANDGKGGVGYEKTILTGQMMQNINTDRVIPVRRKNDSEHAVPTFLLGRLYVDMRENIDFEAAYTELLRDIHGQPVAPRPPLGTNPFTITVANIEPRVSFSSERYVSPANTGTVTFDYSNNDGRYIVGAGDMLFETKWSRGGKASIYVLNDAASIRSVAIANGLKSIREISNAALYDTSSRHRHPRLDESVIWQNSAGYYLATHIEAIKSRGHGDPVDEVTFSYVIRPDKSVDFSAG
jgi:TIR domain